MKKMLLSILLLLLLQVVYVNADDYVEVKSDCVSTCYVYCYVPEEFVVDIPRQGIGECTITGNIDIEQLSIKANGINPINYEIIY